MNGNSTCTAVQVPSYMECQVCFDTWSSPVQLTPCGHIFCAHCARGSDGRCGICRAHITTSAPASDAIFLATEVVPVVCSSCGWRGTRKQGNSHRCNVKDTHTVYERYPQRTDEEWMQAVRGSPMPQAQAGSGEASGATVINGIPL